MKLNQIKTIIERSGKGKVRMAAGGWLNSDLFLCEGEPVNARSGFSFAEQIIQEFGRRIFRFLCRGDRRSGLEQWLLISV